MLMREFLMLLRELFHLQPWGGIVDLATATHDLDDVSLASLGELLGDVVGISDLDVDNVDQPFESPGANVPLFFYASFILAYEVPPAGSPPSVCRTNLSGDVIEGSADHDVAPASDVAGSVPHNVDVVPRNTASLSGEVEPPHPEEGAAVGVAELGAGGSDGHSSVGQHVPGNAVSAPQSRVRR
ncbi:hypothetical protein ACLOJK_022906, partial [Asimina triloba]